MTCPLEGRSAEARVRIAVSFCVGKLLLDRLQKVCGRLVMVEGNHEYRLDRWAAVAAEGRGAYSMLAPGNGGPNPNSRDPLCQAAG